MDLDRIAPEAVPGIRILPVLHDRVDFGSLVTRLLAALDPSMVAVELPTTLADAVRTTVDRLPQMSAVISEEPGEEAVVWVVAPGDHIRYRDRHLDPFPDPYTMHELGPESYLEIVRVLAAERNHDDGDDLRERGMAYHLQRAATTADGTVRALVGEYDRYRSPPLHGDIRIVRVGEPERDLTAHDYIP